MEGEVEHEPRGLGAETLAPALTERDGELGRAVGVGDLQQARGAHRRRVGAVIDGELDGLGLALRALLDALLDPLLLALGGRDAPLVMAAPDLELVHPAGIVGGQVRPERTQRDLLADDDEVRLMALHRGIVSSPGPRREAEPASTRTHGWRRRVARAGPAGSA